MKSKINLGITEFSKKSEIIDMVEKFGVSTIDPRADLKKLYYESKGTLSDVEIEGINNGLSNLESDRLHTHTEVMTHVNKKLNR